VSNTKKLVGSVQATFVGTLVWIAVQMAALIVIARLLAPEEFGLFAAVLVIIRPIQHLLTSGVERAIILQQASLSVRAAGAAGLAVVLTSLAASASLMLFALALDDLALPLAVAAPSIAIGAIGVVARALLRRRMAHGQVMACDLLALIFGNAAAIGLALTGIGAVALAVGAVVQAVVQSALALWFAGRHPWPWPTRPLVGPIFQVAGRVTLTSLLEVLHPQAPPAIIGGFLGVAALGLFNRSTTLVQIPIETLTTAFTRVFFARISQLRDDQEQLRATVLPLLALTGTIILPLAAGMAAAADDLIALMLGPQWAEAAALFPWLCLATAVTMQAHFFAMVNEAALRLRLRFHIQWISSLVTIAALALAALKDLQACAMAIVLGNAVFLILQMWLSARVLRVGPAELARQLLPGATAALVCAGAATLVGTVLPADLAPALRVVVLAGACAVALVGVLATLFRPVFLDLLGYAGLRRML
jgi:lipopolysaccharide exporter